MIATHTVLRSLMTACYKRRRSAACPLRPLSVHSQAHLNKVARQLNEQPRETLQFEPPREVLRLCCVDRLSRQLVKVQRRRAYARMLRNDMHNISLREEIDRRALGRWE